MSAFVVAFRGPSVPRHSVESSVDFGEVKIQLRGVHRENAERRVAELLEDQEEEEPDEPEPSEKFKVVSKD